MFRSCWKPSLPQNKGLGHLMTLDQPSFLSICHSNTGLRKLESGSLKTQNLVPTFKRKMRRRECFLFWAKASYYHPISYFYLGLSHQIHQPHQQIHCPKYKIHQRRNTDSQIDHDKGVFGFEPRPVAATLDLPGSVILSYLDPFSPNLPWCTTKSWISVIFVSLFLNFTKAPHSDNQDF